MVKAEQSFRYWKRGMTAMLGPDRVLVLKVKGGRAVVRKAVPNDQEFSCSLGELLPDKAR